MWSDIKVCDQYINMYSSISYKDSEESKFETLLWSRAYLDVSPEEKDS